MKIRQSKRKYNVTFGNMSSLWDLEETFIKEYYIWEEENNKHKRIRITCEVIEEDNKIEKLDCVKRTKQGYQEVDFNKFQDKINELIDEVNKFNNKG